MTLGSPGNEETRHSVNPVNSGKEHFDVALVKVCYMKKFNEDQDKKIQIMAL